MRYRVSFFGVGAMHVPGLELEARGYAIVNGCLNFYCDEGSQLTLDNVIVVYAAGVWRSVAAVGAFTEATKPLLKETPRADSKRG